MRVFIIICDLLIPLFILGIGYVSSKKAPDNMNNLTGYRTAMSMKNTDTWNFAHQYCGHLWTRIGVILFIISLLACMITVIVSTHQVLAILSIILVIIQTIIVVGSIFLVEKALRNNFDENGNRINHERDETRSASSSRYRASR